MQSISARRCWRMPKLPLCPAWRDGPRGLTFHSLLWPTHLLMLLHRPPRNRCHIPRHGRCCSHRRSLTVICARRTNSAFRWTAVPRDPAATHAAANWRGRRSRARICARLRTRVPMNRCATGPTASHSRRSSLQRRRSRARSEVRPTTAVALRWHAAPQEPHRRTRCDSSLLRTGAALRWTTAPQEPRCRTIVIAESTITRPSRRTFSNCSCAAMNRTPHGPRRRSRRDSLSPRCHSRACPGVCPTTTAALPWTVRNRNNARCHAHAACRRKDDDHAPVQERVHQLQQRPEEPLRHQIHAAAHTVTRRRRDDDHVPARGSDEALHQSPRPHTTLPSHTDARCCANHDRAPNRERT